MCCQIFLAELGRRLSSFVERIVLTRHIIGNVNAVRDENLPFDAQVIAITYAVTAFYALTHPENSCQH